MKEVLAMSVIELASKDSPGVKSHCIRDGYRRRSRRGDWSWNRDGSRRWRKLEVSEVRHAVV